MVESMGGFAMHVQYECFYAVLHGQDLPKVDAMHVEMPADTIDTADVNAAVAAVCLEGASHAASKATYLVGAWSRLGIRLQSVWPDSLP